MIGDQVKLRWEFETDSDWSPSTRFGIILRNLGASSVTTASAMDLQESGDNTYDTSAAFRPAAGVLETPALTLLSDLTGLNAEFRMDSDDGAATVRLGRAYLYKVA